MCTNTHCVKKEHLVSSLIGPVDVAFLFAHMDAIPALSVCVLSSLCDKLVAVCKFTVRLVIFYRFLHL